MFTVDPAAADAIRQAFNGEGELAAIMELRRHFPLLTSNEHARSCVQTIASWKPIVLPSRRQRSKKSQTETVVDV